MNRICIAVIAVLGLVASGAAYGRVPLGHGRLVIQQLGHGYALVYLPGFDSRVPCNSPHAAINFQLSGNGDRTLLKVCFDGGASLNHATDEGIREPAVKHIGKPTSGKLEHITEYECIPSLVIKPTFADCEHVKTAD